ESDRTPRTECRAPRAGAGLGRKQSRDTREGARERRRTKRASVGAPHMSGGSDAPDVSVIASALQGVALCGDCLARKTGIPRGNLEEGLSRIAMTIELSTDVVPCDVCRNQRVVHRRGYAAASTH